METRLLMKEAANRAVTEMSPPTMATTRQPNRSQSALVKGPKKKFMPRPMDPM